MHVVTGRQEALPDENYTRKLPDTTTKPTWLATSSI